MKKKQCVKIRKALAAFITTAMTANMLATMPVAAANENKTLFSYDGYDIEYNITNDWGNGQNIVITVTNTGDEPILNWAFKYNSASEINGLWNATVYDNNGSEYIIKNIGWNYEIESNQSVTFGYTLNGNNLSVPQKFDIWSSRVDADESEYDIQFDIANSWDTGFQGQIVINNLSDEPLEAWEISFDTNFTITNLWTGRINERSDNHYVVSSEMWSNPIQAGASVSFGFTADIESGLTAEINSVGLSKVKIGDPYVDTDGDGIPDIYEKALGTDKNNPDTDGDKVSDYNELLIGTNPLLPDTDGNGITDGDEDYDGDKLTNSEEERYGTDLTAPDTDNDGLSDYDEIFVYGTDPLNPDSDGDGLSDGDEIILGTNPLKQDTDNNGIIDSEEKFQQTFEHKVANEDCVITDVLVDMECTGNINNTTSVESIMDIDILCSNVVGLVGEPFEIETESKFDKATLIFKVDKNKLGDVDFDNLLFLWYNEEENEFVELETVLDAEKGTVSIETAHFSRYMIVDKEAWFDAWAIEFNYNPSEDPMAPGAPTIRYNTVLAIDCSGSMAWNDPNSQRVEAAKQFINYMNSYDKVAIVFFTSNATIELPMSSNADELKRALNNVKSNGGTSFSAALNTSISAFDSKDINGYYVNNRIILLSDGVDEGTTSARNNAIQACIDKNIKVYTVGFGSVNDSIMERIAKETGGTYFKAFSAEDLVDIFTEIGYADDFDMTDTDLDGLPDVVESAGMRLQTGQIIYTDPTDFDSDKDGLWDGEEIDPTPQVKYVYKTGGYEIIKAYYFKKISDPKNKDSDRDGILDRYDIRRLHSDNEIPLEFKKYINNEYVTMDLIDFTNDGFAICNKSIADLLNTVGVYESDIGMVQNWYDDWYVYSIKLNNTTTYSLLKMREEENDGFDGDDAGVSISFAKYNINSLSNSLINGKISNDFDDEIKFVIYANLAKHDSHLETYFAKTSSYAPYLIAETYITKIMNSYNTNSFRASRMLISVLDEIAALEDKIKSTVGAAPNGAEQAVKQELQGRVEKLLRVPNAIKEINNKAGYTICDLFNVYIKDKDNLSIFEQQIILSIYTADVSYNMFAAEVQFHAQALSDWKQYIPLLGSKWYRSAVIADMALGEEYESGVFDEYYNPNSSLVVNQRLYHGDY